MLGYFHRMQTQLSKLHVLFQPTRILLLIQVSFLWHDKPARAPTPCSVPRAACLQNGLQLSCPRSKPSCAGPQLAPRLSVARLHATPAAVQRLSSQHHQACQPGGFPMVKGLCRWCILLCKTNSMHWHNCDYRFCMEGEEKTAFAV